MLSSALNSERAVQVNIAIMRVSVRLREVRASHRDLAEKVEALEGKYRGRDEERKGREPAAPYRSETRDEAERVAVRFARVPQKIRAIFGAIRDLLQPKTPEPRRRSGFSSGVLATTDR